MVSKEVHACTVYTFHLQKFPYITITTSISINGKTVNI